MLLDNKVYLVLGFWNCQKKETNFVPLCAFTVEVKFAVTKRGQFYYITVEVAAVQLSFIIIMFYKCIALFL